jgi:hypothetical protein
MTERKAAPPWTSTDIPRTLTYVYPEDGGVSYQLQWDYQVEWPSGGKPSIILLKYRSFRRNAETHHFDLTEQVSEDIPINELVMMNISKHAAGCLFAYATLDGDWRFVDRTLFDGCAEAAKKRFSLVSLRQMLQADPNPRIL